MEKVNETPMKEQEQPQATATDSTTPESTAAATENMAADAADMTATDASASAATPLDEISDRNDAAAEQNESPVEDELKRLEEELAQEKAAHQELKDKYLRLFAEFDNYKRRTSKERLDILKTASSDVLRELLPIMDDFDRAATAAGEAGLPDGVQLIQEKLVNTLSKKGLKAMESTGEPFDAELHEAITEIPAPAEAMKGKVIDTIEKGYTLNDKIIRYAKVVVGR